MQGLEISNLTKRFGEALAVSDVSLKIEQGSFVCFLGPSGCGKTTLMRIVAGLEQATEGKVLFDGRDMTRVPTHERNFGMVFQALALFPHLNVADNVGYSFRFRAMDKKQRDERVAELLKLVDLPDMQTRRVDQLSGGQRQRVAIARALAQEPLLFLMDEPLSALDAKLRDHMQVELRQLQRKLKITTIFVTHDQREAMTIADKIVVMAHGKVQQVGSPVDIYRRPVNRFVADFIGQSNLLEVQLLSRTQVQLSDLTVEVETVPAGLKIGQTATLCVRPESTVLTPASRGTPGLLGKVTFVRDLGSTVEIFLNVAGREVLASLPPATWAPMAQESEFRISVAPDSATVLED
ncbi:ABC transporter ATP-binding protein [Rhizobium sp. CG5]|uniref:ABC transporter ATP-binding protein n=1 Tax=Rhizobium sp. CG5 TaxID=2726076 RepID=UPI00203448E5|nr:ABC transporter ATP-binding protein [Rhizobium sp. CG5]MCM2473442.1 ABC transporter ATP-binding protein [Rhizobium sp. CG5]